MARQDHQSPVNNDSEAARRPGGFAIPPQLHVLSMCMMQIVAIFLAMLPFIFLHAQVNVVVLSIGAGVLLIGMFFLIASLGKLVRAKCKNCRSPSHYRGLGWWPFTYRYDCRHCGQEMGFEVGGM